MLAIGRIALLIGFGLLFFNIVMGLTSGKIEVATSILGGLILTLGLLARVGYVFSREDED
jgi:hypothetical protein